MVFVVICNFTNNVNYSFNQVINVDSKPQHLPVQHSTCFKPVIRKTVLLNFLLTPPSKPIMNQIGENALDSLRSHLPDYSSKWDLVKGLAKVHMDNVQ